LGSLVFLEIGQDLGGFVGGGLVASTFEPCESGGEFIHA
jgi:hypothetical protein